jgi:hypothetical protein
LALDDFSCARRCLRHEFLFSSFITPKFQQIFADALPGRPLPAVTDFVIGYKIPLALLSLAWPIVAGVLIARRSQKANLWILVGTVWNLFLISITIIALFMPMVGITQGMSDASHQDSSHK